MGHKQSKCGIINFDKSKIKKFLSKYNESACINCNELLKKCKKIQCNKNNLNRKKGKHLKNN